MADQFAKARPGQPLRVPAAAYNAFIDAAKAQRGLNPQAERPFPVAQPRVLVRNDGAATIPRFGVIGIDGPIFDAATQTEGFKRGVAFQGDTPSKANHTGRFAVALEPLRPGALGRVCAGGVCIVKVEFTGDGRDRRYADIKDGVDANLMALDWGAATILWNEDPGAGGVKWAVVRLGAFVPPRPFPVTLTQVGGAQGDSTTAATWTYDVKDALADGPSDPTLVAGADPTADPHQWKRPAVGQMEKATFGYAHWRLDSMGAEELVIGWINEVVGAGACA